MSYNSIIDKSVECDKEDGDGDSTKGDDWYKVDDVLEYFGNIGSFQIKLAVLTSLLGTIAAWRILFDLFSAKFVPWSCTKAGLALGCSNPGSGDTGKRPCEVGSNKNLEDGLKGSAIGIYWQYDQNLTSHSIISTFDLRCDEDWKFSFISSIYFIGAFFGVWMYGRLSDMIGRKMTLMISLGMCVVQGWIIPFFNDMNVYLTCRFFDGMAFGGFFLVAFVLMVEYSPPVYRNKLGTTFHFMTSVGMATIAIWGYIFKVWRWYAVSMAVPPTIMLVVCWFVMPESSRYLLSKGKEDEALQLLQKVADTNGNTMPKPCKLYEDVDVKASLLDILKNKKLLKCAPINMFGWFMTSLVYYMLWFSAKYLAGDIYVNAAILGIAELPGRLFAFFVMDRIGRKKTFMIAMAVACVAMFVSIIDNTNSRKAMYCLGKALSGTLWAVIYLYSSEMYPTKIRNLGSGIGSAAARVAALLAPFVGKLFDVSAVLPYIIVGALAFACCGVFWILPETMDKDLPQTISEFENLFKPAPKKDKNYKQEMLTAAV